MSSDIRFIQIFINVSGDQFSGDPCFINEKKIEKSKYINYTENVNSVFVTQRKVNFTHICVFLVPLKSTNSIGFQSITQRCSVKLLKSIFTQIFTHISGLNLALL
jgi:hypothetical protein